MLDYSGSWKTVAMFTYAWTLGEISEVGEHIRRIIRRQCFCDNLNFLNNNSVLYPIEPMESLIASGLSWYHSCFLSGALVS